MDTEAVSEHIRSVKRGSKESYLALVEAFEYRIRIFLAARSPDRHLVDDLVQTVFIHAYQHLDEYQEGTNFLAWLMAVARMKALAEFKSQGKRAKAHRRYVEYCLASEAVKAAGEEGDAEDRARALSKCLGRLSGQSLEVLRMRYRANMSLQETCSRLGKSVSWGKSFVFRLKRSLQKCVEDQLVSET